MVGMIYTEQTRGETASNLPQWVGPSDLIEFLFMVIYGYNRGGFAACYVDKQLWFTFWHMNIKIQ